MTPTVLLFNLENEKGRKIKALCLPLKLRARSVPADAFSQTLNSLLGLEAAQEDPSAGGTFSGEMLVMAGLSSPQMDRFLQGFRRKKIPPVELKAVLTATNGSWTPCRLYEELRLEREAMLRGENLHEGRPL